MSDEDLRIEIAFELLHECESLFSHLATPTLELEVKSLFHQQLNEAGFSLFLHSPLPRSRDDKTFAISELRLEVFRLASAAFVFVIKFMCSMMMIM
jgi:hypothetical protein